MRGFLVILASRGITGAMTLLVLSGVIFAATQLLPGDAAQAILGRSATPERLAALREQLHLDLAPGAQYLTWLGNVLHGDLGTSLGTGRPVVAQLVPHALNSLTLVGLVIAVAVPVTLLLGLVAALRAGGLFDSVLNGVSLVVAALPEFVVAIVMILLLSTTVLHLFPPVSMILPGSTQFTDPRILVLPVLTLSIIVFPYLFRMVRGSMIDILRSEYIEMARLKGLPVYRILLLHALPNAAAPAVQVIGLTIAYLAGGVAMVEYVFGYPGIGGLLISSVAIRDVPVIQSVVLLLALVYVVTNLAADLAVLALTPKARAGRGSH